MMVDTGAVEGDTAARGGAMNSCWGGPGVAGWGVAPCTIRLGAGAGMGVCRGGGGEAGPGGQLRDTDWGLVLEVAGAGCCCWDEMPENGSSVAAPTAGLELKNDIGEENMLGVTEVAGAGAPSHGLAGGGIAGPAAAAPPPPTKLSSSALATATAGSVAVMPKLSAKLKPAAPPAIKGLLGGFFAIFY